MSNHIGRASILLTADTASFESEIVRARDTAQGALGDIRQQAMDMGQALKTGVAMGTVALGALSTTVGVAVKEQMELVNALNSVAMRANTTTAEIQKYTFAAKAMGVEQDKLGDIFKDTQDKVGDFLTTGGGELADFFELVSDRVGVTAEQFRTLSGPEALQLYYDSLEKANLSQSEMIFYLESIADDASVLIPLLKNGGEGFKLWEDAARNAGAVMDEKTIRATQELNTSTQLLNLSYQGVKNQLAMSVMPVLSDMAGSLVRDANLKNAAARAGDMLAGSFKVIIGTGRGVVGIMQMIGTAIGGMTAVIANPLSAIEILKYTYQDLKNIVRDTNGALDGILSWGNGGTNATVSQLTNIQTEQERIKNLGAMGKDIAEQKKKEEEAQKSTKQNLKEYEKKNPFVGNHNLLGLSIKSKESTAGGNIRQATAEFAHITQNLLGSELKYFSAFNDKYHLGRKSDHNQGAAFDIVLKDAKQSQKVSQQLIQTANQLGYDIKVLNEYIKPSKHSTGGHIHVSIKGYATEKDKIKQSSYILPSEQSAWQNVLANAQKYEFAKYEQLNNLPTGLLSAVHMKETKGGTNVSSQKGAGGGFQLMIGTAKDLGLTSSERFDMTKATPAAAKYLRQLLDRYHGDVNKALAAYNAGMGNVDKYKGIPPFRETQDYVKGVNRYLSAMQGGGEVKGNLNPNEWLAQVQKQEQEAQRQAQVRLNIEKEFADEKTKLLFKYQEKEKEILKAGFGGDEQTKYLELAKAEYQHGLDLIQLEQDKRLQASIEYKQTEAERIVANADLERRSIALNTQLSEELRTAMTEAVNHKERQALAELNLDRDKAWQAATQYKQTEAERIKANAELERREIWATVHMDEELRQANIDRITHQELQALEQLQEAYRRELDEMTSHGKTELQRLRDEYKNKRYANQTRTDISDEQKRQLGYAIDGAEIHAVQSLQNQARGQMAQLQAELGGVGDLHNIEAQHKARLDLIKNLLDNEVMTVEEAEKAKQAIRMQYAQDMLGVLSSSAKSAFGEQSRAYQMMFAMQKGVAIAQASIAMYQNISQAMAKGFPANVPLIAQAMTQGMGIIANIKAIKSSVVGQAHDGIMAVPKSGTWNLEKGERVLPKHTAQNLDRTLAELQGKGRGETKIIINNYSGEKTDVQQMPNGDMMVTIGKMIDAKVDAKINQRFIQARRQGGELYGR